MSTVAFAATNVTMDENKGQSLKQRILLKERVKFDGNREALRSNVPEDIKALCDELTVKLNNGEITREQFCDEMREANPDRMKSQQERWQNKKGNVPDELKEKFIELKTQQKNGEINQDQFREEIRQLRQK